MYFTQRNKLSLSYDNTYPNRKIMQFCEILYSGLIAAKTVYHILTLKKKPFKNIVRKGENADNHHFLLLPQCYRPISKRTFVVNLPLFCRLRMLSNWTSLKSFRLLKS